MSEPKASESPDLPAHSEVEAESVDTPENAGQADTSDVSTTTAVGLRDRLGGLRTLGVEALVLVVAIAARLYRVASHGGLRGIMGYDCGVYFAGADALIHGRMPYRDFTMVHPPGILLVLTPFATLTRWMTDWHAFIVATLAFVLLGGINALLVVRVCRRLGFGALASCAGGLFYAAWYGSISGEFEVKLEPLGNLFLLCGLLLLLRAQRSPTGWANVLAGVVLGVTLTVKIWWAVPVVLLVLWQAYQQRSVKAGAYTVLGVAIPVLVIYTPFFLADPSGMYSSVVTDQLGRPPRVNGLRRIESMTTLPYLRQHLSHSTMALAAALFSLVVLAVLFLAWRACTTARALVALVAVQLIVLLVAPSWYPYYADYVAVGLAICIGAAASSVTGMQLRWLRRAPSLALTAAIAIIALMVTFNGTQTVSPYPPADQFARDVSQVKCVTAVNTTVLIRLNALTRGLENGCPNWIDVTGKFLALSKQPKAIYLPERNQQEIAYLRSGDAVILDFGHHVRRPILKAIAQDGVLSQSGHYVIYRGGQ